ncbi:MAG TPA: hypothetical protein VIH57_18580, partial [Bacteroidales bacterium]
MMEHKENFEEIVIKYIAGLATDTERAAVNFWLKESEANKRLFDELKDVYEVSGRLKENEADTEKSWEKVKAKYYQHKLDSEPFEMAKFHLKWTRKFLRVAAIFVVAFLLGILSYYYISQYQAKSEPLAYNEVIAP